MRHEYKKVARIVDELTTFFLEKNAKDVSLDIKILDKKEIVTIKVYPVEDMDTVIEDLQRMLSCPRESEMEEYYWELAGEGDNASELGLIGTMIDSASIDYDDESLCLEIVRRR